MAKDEETEGWGAEDGDDGDDDGDGEKRGKKEEEEDRRGRNTEDCGGDGPRHRCPDRRAA